MKYNWNLEVKPNISGEQVVTVTKINPVEDKPVSVWTYPLDKMEEAVADMQRAMKHDIDINQKVTVELTLNEIAELAIAYQYANPEDIQVNLDNAYETKGYGFMASNNDNLTMKMVHIIQEATNP